jgi:hypothetical protein
MCKSQLEGNRTIAKSWKHPKLSLIGDFFTRVPRKKFEVNYSYRGAATEPESVTRLCPAAVPNKRPSRLHSTASSRLHMWKRKTCISLTRITYLCILSLLAASASASWSLPSCASLDDLTLGPHRARWGSRVCGRLPLQRRVEGTELQVCGAMSPPRPFPIVIRTKNTTRWEHY